MDIKLGHSYRDMVSGWEGVAIARYEYMNGCVRYEIAGADKDGKPEAFVFDQEQLLPVGSLSVDQMRTMRAAGGDRSQKPVPR